MTRFHRFPYLFSILFLLPFLPGALQAQPSSSDLAERLERAYQERISAINGLEIHTVTSGGFMDGITSQSVYEKVEREGRYVLVEVDEEDSEGGVFEGLFDNALPDMVRNASSISNDRYEGIPVYRIEVDDPEYLDRLAAGSIPEEEMDDSFQIDSATLMIDSQELLARYVQFRQTGEGGESLTVHFRLSDYRNHSGFPVPYLVTLELEGLDQMISDEDRAEAREAMEQMERQLAEMPEAQRRMIEEQMRPQMERFEAMFERDELGEMQVEVTQVIVH